MFVRVHDSTPQTGRTRARGRAQRSFEVHVGRNGRVQLRLWGSLPRGWAGHLTAGLAEAGLSVVRGFGRRGAGSSWIAAFELERTPGGVDPMLVDYLELAALGGSHPAPAPEIERHRSAPSGPGKVVLEVEAKDRPGLLAGLLERLALLDLEPDELEIRTEPEGARDRLTLRTADGCGPSPATLCALDEILGENTREDVRSLQA